MLLFAAFYQTVAQLCCTPLIVLGLVSPGRISSIRNL